MSREHHDNIFSFYFSLPLCYHGVNLVMGGSFMNDPKEAVYTFLQQNNISYQTCSHSAVYTIEEMMAQNIPHSEAIAKNLFVRDDNKRHYYLIVIRGEKRVDLKQFAKTANTRRLGFASEKDLFSILSLTRGSVTPLGILNDSEKKVTVFFDQSYQHQLIAVHPNENTATVYLNADDLFELIKAHGNPISWLTMDWSSPADLPPQAE